LLPCRAPRGTVRPCRSRGDCCPEARIWSWICVPTGSRWSCPTVRWLVVLAGAALFVWGPLRRIVAWATSHFVVTTDRVIHRAGWFAKHSMEIPLENISDVRFNQTVFERAIGAGDLTLESPGTFGQERFSDVRHPEHVQKTIYEMNEANRQRMSGAGQAGGSSSVADELAKLDRLRDDGVISDQEFEAQKARLLGRS
jgi:uncharacterized membrane protein YdbT with pleckstrin-like domain